MPGSKLKRERRERWERLKHDPEFAEDVLERVATGESVMTIAAVYDVAYSTLANWLVDTRGQTGAPPELAQKYARAREHRAGYQVAEIERYIEDIAAGRMDPKAGKVVIDGRQWLAARLDPHLWGDKQTINHNVTSVVQQHIAVIREYTARPIDQADQTPTIEHDEAEDAEYRDVIDGDDLI